MKKKYFDLLYVLLKRLYEADSFIEFKNIKQKVFVNISLADQTMKNIFK